MTTPIDPAYVEYLEDKIKQLEEKYCTVKSGFVQMPIQPNYNLYEAFAKGMFSSSMFVSTFNQAYKQMIDYVLTHSNPNPRFRLRPRLPDPVVLRRIVPDDYRYGDVLGYTADQMLSFANDRVRHALEKVANNTAVG